MLLKYCFNPPSHCSVPIGHISPYIFWTVCDI